MRLEKARFVLWQIAHGMIRPQKEINEAVDTVFGELDKRRWIPVTERLPENPDMVLVTYVFDADKTMPPPTKEMVKTAHPKIWKKLWEIPEIGMATHYSGGWFGPGDDEPISDELRILAWMPLPEPYRGGDA